MDASKESMSSRQNTIDAHINSQRMWQFIQGLHRFKTDRIPAQESGGSEQRLPPLAKKLCPNDTC